MKGNREDRITFRVDPETSVALSRYIARTKERKSSVIHRALHEFLLIHDALYRADVSGNDNPLGLEIDPISKRLNQDSVDYDPPKRPK